uniref:Uncharacterized protein n=1 Tax=Anguilla anguilla TaxID=7936 RepID=A0A0E9U3W3_ANGAN
MFIVPYQISQLSRCLHWRADQTYNERYCN